MARLRRGSAFAVYLSGPRDRRRSCAVQVFLPWAKILAEAEFTSAEHFNFPRNPKKKDTTAVVSFFLGAGNEARTRFPASREWLAAIRRSPASPLIKTRLRRGVEAACSPSDEKNRTPNSGCPVSLWSGQRGSNSLPPPWQGGALPDELCPRNKGYSTRETPACQDSSVRFSVFSSAESPASPPITNSISPTGPCAG